MEQKKLKRNKNTFDLVIYVFFTYYFIALFPILLDGLLEIIINYDKNEPINIYKFIPDFLLVVSTTSLNILICVLFIKNSISKSFKAMILFFTVVSWSIYFLFHGMYINKEITGTIFSQHRLIQIFLLFQTIILFFDLILDILLKSKEEFDEKLKEEENSNNYNKLLELNKKVKEIKNEIEQTKNSKRKSIKIDILESILNEVE